MNKSRWARTLISVCVIFVNTLFSYGQNESKTKAVKLYTNGSFGSHVQTLQVDTSSTSSVTSKSFNYGGFSPAMTLYKPSGNFLEIELSQLSITNSDDKTSLTNNTTKNTITVAGSESSMILFGLRIEHGIRLVKNKDESNWKPYIGLGVNPYFSSVTSYPKVSNSFASRISTIAMDLSVFPRITYDINEKVFLDFNVPINVSTLTSTISKIENPSFTARQQKTSSFKIETLANRYAFRLGVGLKL